ncbi:MAG: 50S ribosomal protein L18, partial [Thermoprotei archaeon]
MAKGPTYKVPLRRRREGKTDYRLRKKLILSGLPRLVVRGSLKHFTVQVTKAEINGDRVLASAHTKQLVRDFGWRGACGNIPAAYLTGLLAGLRAVNNGIKKAVLDIGLFSPIKGSRVFAALKGAIDAGMEIPCSEEVLP